VKCERGLITNISQSTYKPPPSRRGLGEVKTSEAEGDWRSRKKQEEAESFQQG